MNDKRIRQWTMAFNTTYLCMHIFIFLLNIKAGVFKDFRVVLLQSKIYMFCYVLQIENLYCLVVFLTFKGFSASLKSSFFEFGKILPHPREFDHHFLPRGQGIRQKNCPGGRDSLAQKNFPRGCPGNVSSWN